MAPQITQIQRERIVGLKLAGYKIIEIQRNTGISRPTIHRWLQRFERDGTIEAYRRTLFARATTAAQDAEIVERHLNDPFLNTRVTAAENHVMSSQINKPSILYKLDSLASSYLHIETSSTTNSNHSIFVNRQSLSISEGYRKPLVFAIEQQNSSQHSFLVSMLRRSRTGKEWEVRVSALARNTHNLIRSIVENLDVEPNPNKQLIALSVGDPTVFGNLNPPDNVLQAVRESLEMHTSRSYAPSVGHVEARKAVAEYSAHQGDIKPEDVILSSGCSHAIELAITVLADSGQNILVPRPGFMIYKTLAEGLGIEIKYYKLMPDKQWKVDLEDLENQIDDETAAIVVINPSNPCGSVYNKEHLYEILDVAARNRVPIIADEIYEHFVFSGHEFTAMSAISKDVPILTCSGLTKRFLVPGWRMGWVIVHDRHNVFGKEVRKGLINLSQRILGPSAVIQKALPSILKYTPQSFYDELVLFIENQAKVAYEELLNAPGLRPIMPQGAMYMMVEIKMALFPEFKNELQFVERMVAEQSVFCLPGQCFMYPNYMRLVLTVPEDKLREACQRIILFCLEHVVSRETLHDIDNVVAVPCESNIIC